MLVERETVLGFRGEGAPPLLPDLEVLVVVDMPLGARPRGGLAPRHGRPTRPREGRMGRSGRGEGQGAVKASMAGRVACAWGRHYGRGREEAGEGPPRSCAPPLLPHRCVPWFEGRERRR